jgi:AraC family transcriptional regulator, transcriptional activator of pobA
VEHITTITDYCAEINIPPPRHPFFDIRSFEENMKTVNAKQPPFRHEFYAIALRHAGSNSEVMGKPLHANLFFNSPYQLITWDILPDWKGWYILFDREFLSMNTNWENFIIDYPFFRLDKSMAFDLPRTAFEEVNSVFKKIFEEYHSPQSDKFEFIQAYTQILLSLTKRAFEKITPEQEPAAQNRAADVLLVSRFQTLIETTFTEERFNSEIRQPSFYAEALHVHPNHLNAVVKRITDKTASQLIQQHLMTFAKSLLRQTSLSVKEVSYRLHFSEPTHFNAFFKKQTGTTPQQYRDNLSL